MHDMRFDHMRHLLTAAGAFGCDMVPVQHTVGCTMHLTPEPLGLFKSQCSHLSSA